MTFKSLIVFVIICCMKYCFATYRYDVTPIGGGIVPSEEPKVPNVDQSNDRNCPKVCQCEEHNIWGRKVTCKGQSLTGIPDSLLNGKETRFTAYLNLNLNQIFSLPSKAFTGFSALRELHLSGNFLQEIRSNMFTGLTNLQELYLQDNKLSTIPPNVFAKIQSLTILSLASNYIKFVSDTALAGLNNLEELSFDDNMLTSIPTEAVQNLIKLKALDLQINQITEIPDRAFRDLNLEVLLLSHNKISIIHNDAFEGQENMLVLNLANNELTDFPRVISHLTSLRTLKLSGNKISVIPEHAFAQNPHLSCLTLSGNPIRIIGRTAFVQLPHLESLYLEDIKDQKVFPNFDGCKSLTSLSLTGGQIKQIPHDICIKLPSLYHLVVSNNMLGNFSGLSHCKNLTSLDVSNNLIEKVRSADLANLNKLQSIDLGCNAISSIHDDAFVGANLRQMNLAYNYFTFLPVKGLRNLRELNVSGVQTMLYLPPVELLPNLRKLSAFYPYHCCQLTSASRTETNKNEEIFSSSQMIANPFLRQQQAYGMRPYIQCGPNPGPLHPCDDLLPSNGLRGFGWLALIIAVVSNVLLVIFFIAKYSLHRRIRSSSSSAHCNGYFQEVLISQDDLGRNQSMNLVSCNLSLADLAVCGYLAILLTYDAATRGRFAEHGAWWQQSSLCHVASFLLVFGTQLAFFSLVMMTVERYLVTMHPNNKTKHLRKTSLYLTMTASWVFSSVTAIVTLLGGDAYNGKGILPSLSSSTCLPWTTEFKYIAILVSVHIAACIFTMMLCLRMICIKKKLSWLSYHKNAKWQTAFTFSLNTSVILPLSVIALYIAIVTTFSSTENDLTSENERDIITGNSYVDMQSILIFVLTMIPLRCVLNIVLYIAFNRQYRAFLLRLICIKSKSDKKFALVNSEYVSELQSIPPHGATSTSYDEPHYDTHTESTGYDTSLSQYVDYRGHGLLGTRNNMPSSDYSYTHNKDWKSLLSRDQIPQYKLSKPVYHGGVIDEVIEEDSSINAQEEFRHFGAQRGVTRTYHDIIGIDKPLRHSSPSRSSRSKRKPYESTTELSSHCESDNMSTRSTAKHYDLSALNNGAKVKCVDGSLLKRENTKSESSKIPLNKRASPFDPGSGGVYASVIMLPEENLVPDEKTLTQSDINNFLPQLRDYEEKQHILRDFPGQIFPPNISENVQQEQVVVDRKQQRSSESYDSSKDSGIHSEVDSTSVASDAGETHRVNLVVTSQKQLSTSTTTNYMSTGHCVPEQSDNISKEVYVDRNRNNINYLNSMNLSDTSYHMETTI